MLSWSVFALSGNACCWVVCAVVFFTFSVWKFALLFGNSGLIFLDLSSILSFSRDWWQYLNALHGHADHQCVFQYAGELTAISVQFLEYLSYYSFPQMCNFFGGVVSFLLVQWILSEEDVQRSCQMTCQTIHRLTKDKHICHNVKMCNMYICM